jgi:hypothetical protein
LQLELWSGFPVFSMPYLDGLGVRADSKGLTRNAFILKAFRAKIPRRVDSKGLRQ